MNFSGVAAEWAWQAVVKVALRTEGGDARGGQDAMSENRSCIGPRSKAGRIDAAPVECCGTFPTAC